MQARNVQILVSLKTGWIEAGGATLRINGDPFPVDDEGNAYHLPGPKIGDFIETKAGEGEEASGFKGRIAFLESRSDIAIRGVAWAPTAPTLLESRREWETPFAKFTLFGSWQDSVWESCYWGGRLGLKESKEEFLRRWEEIERRNDLPDTPGGWALMREDDPLSLWQLGWTRLIGPEGARVLITPKGWQPLPREWEIEDRFSPAEKEDILRETGRAICGSLSGGVGRIPFLEGEVLDLTYEVGTIFVIDCLQEAINNPKRRRGWIPKSL